MGSWKLMAGVVSVAAGAACGQGGAPTEQPQQPAGVKVQEEPPKSPPVWPEEERWTLQFEPSAWYAGLSGDLQLPRSSEDAGGNETTDLENFNMNSASLVQPLGEITLRRGRWGFCVRGTSFSSDRSATGVSGQIGDVAIADGDRLNASVDLIDAEFEVLYTPYREALRPRKVGFWLRPRLDLVFGLRVIENEWQIENLDAASPTSEASADEMTVHPLVGFKLSGEISEQFTVDVKVDLGALPLPESWSYGADILVGGTWRPVPHIGAQIGYRALFVGLSSGSDDAAFEFSGAVQGLYAGLRVDF